MTDEMEGLERRLDALRAELRRAAGSGDRDRAAGLRAELRAAEREWEAALDELEAEQAVGSGGPDGSGRPAAERSARSGALLPAREQVHQALALLGGPAAPRLIVEVHRAFGAGRLDGTRLTSLRRDEERSFRAAPYARPYYVCAALTADLLAPARGLLALSTWPMQRRVIGPLSPRVDYLAAAIAVAGRIGDLPGGIAGASAQARRLLWRFAANIPHATENSVTIDPDQVAAAARAELAVHQQADSEARQSAALRARSQLGDAEQLFGAGLRASRRAAGGA